MYYTGRQRELAAVRSVLLSVTTTTVQRLHDVITALYYNVQCAGILY